MQPSDLAEGLARSVQGAVSSVFDATIGPPLERAVGRVGGGAVQLTAASTEQVIAELEPYLINEAVPAIVAGVTPFIAESVVPEILARLNEHLVTVTVPGVIDGVSDHLVERTVPQVADGVSSHLIAVTVPEVVAGVTPVLVSELLPRILEELRPYLSNELVPGIVEELMPKLQAQIAPQLLDSLMPKVRAEVVPSVLDDIVDDPRVRDLIREQSLGLILDALERGRHELAEADDLAETVLGRVLRVPRGPRDPLGAPPGRDFPYAGVVTRGLALVLDLTLAIWLLGIALSTSLNVLGSLVGAAPSWAVAAMTTLTASLAPTYLAVCWWAWGATAGMGALGLRLSQVNGARVTLVRSLFRAWILLPLLIVWAVGMLTSARDPRRRGWLDRVTGTEVRYFVSTGQRNRHLRNQLSRRSPQAGTDPQRAASPPVTIGL